MRDDFHKVVVERPRRGSSLPSRKTGWSIRHYDPGLDYAFPTRESSSWNWNFDRKEFSDRLGPLKRYLDKQVGRPWRKLEGEFRSAIDTRTVIGRHLWDHARGMVEVGCRVASDGELLSLDGYPVRGLYVHPRSGLLLRVKPRREDETLARRKRLEKADSAVLDARTQAEKVDGLWYLFIDTGRSEAVLESRLDANGKTILVRTTRPLIRKKQANTREIARIRAALEASLP